MKYEEYLAGNRLPHLWCPGCGNGITLKALLLALAEMGLKREEALLATGIGCSGRAGEYVNFHSFQGTHGRTLAFATGIHLARPELKIICLMGDGDCAAIGAGHFLHAARRNINLTALVINNFNYGMTGGQFSPLTPAGSLTSTSHSGKMEGIMDLCRLAEIAGANYVARTTVFHAPELKNFILEAIAKKGFSFVEVLSSCPTYYGRYNKIGGPVKLMEWLKSNTVSLKKFEQLAEEDKSRLFWRGKLVDRNAPDFLTLYLAQEGGSQDK
ncbi:MAG: 2-oxoacid:ferredoxin oxidoreductase subunit beta [Peptococcaceae bacterium]|nr:MAG: 2-oxoacid:ferredoxin oxidoreductase subunit beta [Peptococcaceae bacterium]